MSEYDIKPGDIYRHFKGNRYEIITLARDCEDGSQQVVYKALYPPYEVFVRSYAQFVEKLNPAVYPAATQKYRFEKEEDAKDVTVGKRQFVGNIPEKPADTTMTRAEENVSPVTVRSSDGNIVPAIGETSVVNSVQEEVRQPEYEESHQPENTVPPGLLKFLNCETYEDRIEVLKDLEGRISDQMFTVMFTSLDFPVPAGDAEEKYKTLMKRLQIMSEFDGKRVRP